MKTTNILFIFILPFPKTTTTTTKKLLRQKWRIEVIFSVHKIFSITFSIFLFLYIYDKNNNHTSTLLFQFLFVTLVLSPCHLFKSFPCYAIFLNVKTSFPNHFLFFLNFETISTFSLSWLTFLEFDSFYQDENSLFWEALKHYFMTFFQMFIQTFFFPKEYIGFSC